MGAVESRDGAVESPTVVIAGGGPAGMMTVRRTRGRLQAQVVGDAERSPHVGSYSRNAGEPL